MPQHNFSHISVLIIDDEALMRKLVRGVLASFGFANVMEASSGLSARDMLSRHKFDFIITDWRMEDFDGIDVVKYVRGSRKLPECKTPIIMLTGNTEKHHVKSAINAGINAYLIKPFSAEHLARRIRDLIENPRDFVLSESYRGPDRRHSKAPFSGPDRRKNRKNDANKDLR